MYVGASSQDIRLVGEITREGTVDQFPASEQIPTYLTAQVQAVSEQDFAQLLGRPVPEETWKIGQELSLNDPVLKLNLRRVGWHVACINCWLAY